MTNIQNLFTILNYISLVTLMVCLLILIKQAPSQMQKYALAATFSLFICCVGFLFRTETQTVETLVLSQKLVYSFNAFGMYYVLMFILEYCGYSVNKYVKAFFQLLNALLTFAVLTLDYHDWFYKSYWLVNEGGFISLEKEYGFMHTVAIALFALYMAAAVIITIIYSINNSKRRIKNVWLLELAVAVPCGTYIITKILDIKNDLMPVAFAIFVVMIIVMIYKNNLYDVNNIAINYSLQAFDEAIIVVDKNNLFKGCNQRAKELFNELKVISFDESIIGTSKIIDNLLVGNYDDYLYNDKVYGVSVSSVKNDSGNEIGKVIRLKDVTIERNYTNLLKSENKSLESRVKTLSSYSYQDSLTDCNNRRYFEEELAEIRKLNSLNDIVVWSIDVNGLKETNDTIGHVAGDEAIKATGDILKEVFCCCGKVFRTGGDEFFVITKKPKLNTKSLTKKINDLTNKWSGDLVEELSVSCGIVECKDYPDKNIDEIVIIADKLMYENKREYYETTGKDRRKN